MKHYMYEFNVKECGYQDIRFKEDTQCQRDKWNYVVLYLLPAVNKANCGWESVEYRVMRTLIGVEAEFVVLWSGEINHSGSRWINVTGESMGSIMCSVCDNLW